MADEDATLPKPDPLTMATLQLCSISYARDITTIPALIAAMPPIIKNGRWMRLWGPVQSQYQSNLAFVAGSLNQAGGVESICVTIRGTNIYLGEDIWGILQQIWQDIDATSQVRLPWLPPSSPVRIAQGTMDGLNHIIGLTDSKGVSLGDYLKKTLGTPAYSNIKTVVTGHSLGGCLATVVAPWIEFDTAGLLQGHHPADHVRGADGRQQRLRDVLQHDVHDGAEIPEHARYHPEGAPGSPRHRVHLSVLWARHTGYRLDGHYRDGVLAALLQHDLHAACCGHARIDRRLSRGPRVGLVRRGAVPASSCDLSGPAAGPAACGRIRAAAFHRNPRHRSANSPSASAPSTR